MPVFTITDEKIPFHSVEIHKLETNQLTCFICCVVIVFAFRALVVWLVFSIRDSINNSNALDITTGTAAATCK